MYAIAPQIVIGEPSPSITTNGPVSYTITYRGGTSNTVSSSLSLGTNGITTNGEGTATGTYVLTSNSPTTYTLYITNIVPGALGGILGFSIAPGTAVDTNGNPAAAALATNVVVLPTNGVVGGPTGLTLNPLILDFKGIPGATYIVQSSTCLLYTSRCV